MIKMHYFYIVRPNSTRAKVTGTFTHKSWFSNPEKVRSGISDKTCKQWSDVDGIVLLQLNRI